ncbi:MAG: ATP-binding protein [Nitrospinota bacterium]
MFDKNDQEFIQAVAAIRLPELSLPKMLSKIVSSSVSIMAADASAILLLDESKKRLVPVAASGVNGAIDRLAQIPVDFLRYQNMIGNQNGIVIEDSSNSGDSFFTPLIADDDYRSLLVTTISYNNELFGLLYVRSIGEGSYSQKDIKQLELIAENISHPLKLVLDIDRVNAEAKLVAKENQFAKELTAIQDEKEIIYKTLEYLVNATAAKGGFILLFDQNKRLSIYSYLDGRVDRVESVSDSSRAFFDDIIAKGKTVRIDDINASDNLLELKRFATRSLIGHPLEFEDLKLGLVLLVDKQEGLIDASSSFPNKVENILLFAAQLTSYAIHRTLRNQELDDLLTDNSRSIRELSILFQLSMATQRTIKLDTLLRVILSFVTVGSGLRFNRAILFLLNKSKNTIEGIIGIGPSSGDEAGKIWFDLQGKTDDLTSFISELMQSDSSEIEDSTFSKRAQSLKFHMSDDNIITRAIKEGKAYNIKGDEDLSEGDAKLVSVLNNNRFAVAPLATNDATQGLILVDNFINENPITDLDMELLVRFVASAAWAIGNIQLMERLASVNSKLISLEGQMAYVERMSALGEIYSELAHEIKNPLVSLGGFARRLERYYDNPQEIRRNSKIILNEVERLEKLLQSTLDTSKSTVQSNPKVINLNEIAEEAVEMYWRVINEKGIQFQLKLADKPVMVKVDPSQMTQVIINLLLNGIDAMSCMRHSNLEKKLMITTELNGKNGQIIIQDTGGGVALADVDKIFDPFFTTKKSGTGLGLSLCKKIIRMSHGSLKLENELGVGAAFKINIPTI